MRSAIFVWVRFFLVVTLGISSSLFDLSNAQAAPEAHLGPVLYGVTQGEASVDAQGAANYSIAVEIPPGTNGMVPNLSLRYNSLEKNGLLGMGWQIDGLDTKITRCAQTIDQDGQSRAVDYSAEDRFCLNGRRLSVVGGVYGADGSEYRTELDEYSRIIAHGSTTGNPEYWIVERKDGVTQTFGGTSDARMEVKGGSEHSLWYLSKSEDELGNYYNVSYTRPGTIATITDSYIRPNRIDYTGNAGQSLSPYASIRFEYEARTDITYRHELDKPIYADKRLKNIKSFVGETLVMDYQLSYDYSPSSKRSRLISLRKCSFGGYCTEPSIFNWSDSGDGSNTLSGIDSTGPSMLYGTIMGDFNGDGRTDVLQQSSLYYNGDANLYLADENGDLVLAQAINYNHLGAQWSSYYTNILTGDFNGDGRTDLLLQPNATSSNNLYFYILLADANGHFTSVLQSEKVDYPDYHLGFRWRASAHKLVPGDYNGDGRTDLYFQGSSWSESNYLALADSDGKFTSVHQSAIFNQNYTFDSNNAIPGDFNGDGKTDLLFQRITGQYAQVALSDQDGKFTSSTAVYSCIYVNCIYWGADQSTLIPGDFNGDGRTDFFVQKNSSSKNSQVVVANEAGNFNQDSIRHSFSTVNYDWRSGDATIHTGDFNGDGLTDLFVDAVYKSRIHFAQPDSTFTSAANAQQILTSEYGIHWDYGIYKWQVGDFNGDGYSDLLNQTHNTNHSVLYGSAGQPLVDQLISVIDGLGAQTNFSYKPMTDNSVYTRGVSAVYPDQDLESTRYLVSEFKQSDGIGGLNTDTYFYEGAKRHLTGRGDLGFAKITAIATNHNKTTITEYEQSFPFDHLPKKREVRRTSDNRLLSSEENTYSILGSPLMAASSVNAETAGSVSTNVLPYLDVRVEKTYDLTDGSLLATKTTTNQYGTYGNVTNSTIVVQDHADNQTFETQTTNTYYVDTTNWRVGQQLTETVQKKVDGVVDPSLGSVRSYTYDSATGALSTLTHNPNAGAPSEITETYTQDGYGNIIAQMISGPGIAPSTSSKNYDGRGQFPVTIIDALGNQEDRVYDDRFGVMTSLSDNNNLVTSWQYNNFGQVALETRSDSSTVETSVHLDNSGSNPNAVFYTEVIATGVPPVRTFVDALSRSVRVRTQDSSSNYIHKDTEYNTRGLVERTTEYYPVGTTIPWNTYTYDDLDRVIGLAAADNNKSYTTSYQGFTEVVTYVNGHIIITVKNVIGQIKGVFDNQKSDIAYTSIPNSDGDGSYSISWNQGGGLYTSYTLQEQTNGGSWITIQDSASTSKTISGKGNGTYGYQVKGCVSLGCSDYTSLRTVDVAIAPSVPASISISPNPSIDDNHTVSWGSSSGDVTKYQLEQNFNGSGYVLKYSGTALSYFIDDLVNGSYSYRIRACKTTGSFTNCSDYQTGSATSVNTAVAPGVPQNLTVPANDDDGAYTVSWSPGTGAATRFELQELAAGSSWISVQNNSATSYSVTGSGSGSYSYKVRACNASGCSNFTAAETVTETLAMGSPVLLTPAINATVPSNQDTCFTWQAVAGVTYYNVQISLGTDFPAQKWVFKDATTANPVCWSGGAGWEVLGTNPLPVSLGLKPGEINYWRVWAKDAPNGNHVLTTISNLGSFTVGDVTGNGSVNTPPAPYVATPPLQNAAEVLVSDQVGSTAGQFRVDESGSATYSIPIATAAGTAGVAPQISLNYTSQGGNGLVGKGWNIGGLSGITRCRQTLQQDGVAKPITWSSEDRFCLDGQRLVVTSSGNYGKVGSTYKTETDSFAKVTAHGGNAGHPDYFSVERKDGSTSYYGFTADSQQKAGSSNNVLTWALNEFNDSVGNAIKYVYSNDSNGQRIDQILFAYGGSGSSQAYLDFDYEAREDDISGYVGGYQFQTTQRLTTVKSYNNGILIRSYSLAYLATPTGNSANKSSKLSSIQECRGASCLPATTFTWEANQIGFNTTASQSSFVGDAMGNYRPTDINGDGKMDLVWTRLYIGTNHVYYHLRYALSDGTKLTDMGWDIPYGETKPGSARKPREWDILDYNGDGRTDVAIKEPTGYTYKIYLSKPQADGSWKLSNTAITTPSLGVQTAFADVDSDGLAEVVYVEPFGTKFYMRDLIHDTSQGIDSNHYYKFGDAVEVTRPWPDFEFVPGIVHSPSGVSIDTSAFDADFNGDGITDLVANYAYPLGIFGGLSGRHILIKQENTNSYEIYAVLEAAYVSYSEMGYRDLNGDGLTDIYFRARYGGHWGYMLNTGEGFGATTNLGLLDNTEEIQLADYNQDGFLDIVWHDGSNQLKVRTWASASESFNTEVNIKSTSGSNNIKHILLDVNGDGVSDYVKIQMGTSNYIQVYQNFGVNQARNVITKITNGLSADIDITYGSLSNSGHYERITIGTTSQESQFCWYQGGTCQNYTYTVADTVGFYSALNGDWDIPAGSHTFGKGMNPVLELNGPIYVVTDAKSDAPVANNVEAQSHISYYYGEAKLQASGRGFLGFHKIKSVDEQTGVETTTTYRQDFPFIGYPARTEVRTGAVDPNDRKLLSEAENIWKLQGWSGVGTPPAAPYRPYIAASTEKTYSTSTNLAVADKLDVSTTVLQTVITQNTYDAYGNPLTINVATTGDGDSFSKNTTNLYGSSTYDKEKGRLSRSAVVSTRNGQSETRASAFNYYASGYQKGLLQEEIIEPDYSAYTLTTSYEYDSFGNKVKTTQSAAGETSRFTEWVYDSAGRYVEQTKNGLGQITEQVISRNEYGAPTQIQNIDGVNTYISYSLLGREYFRFSDNGAWSQTLSALGSTAPNGKYQVTTTQAGGGQTVEHFDRLGRNVRNNSRSFDGSWTYQDTQYDNLGRVTQVSQPYFSGSTIYWTTNNYDVLGRVIQTSTPDDAASGGSNDSSISYNGLTTVYTNDKGQTKTESKNVQGELQEVIDHLGGKLLYSYDPQGNMTQLQAIGSTSSSGLANGVGGSITTSLSYDLLGRKISMNDPDKGTWHYNYNHFGELTAQLDAKGQCSLLTYDILGRQETRKDSASGTESNGVINCITSNLEGDTQWVYRDVGPGLGQLSYVWDSKTGYIKMNRYDAYGRLDDVGTSLGINGIDGDYFEKVTYDQYSRTFQIFDAARNTEEYNDNGIEYQYNSYGYLSKVVDAVTANDTTYYEVLEMDARGNVKKERLGNGHSTVRTYDATTGRLKHLGAGLGATLNTIQDIDYQWDQLGNLTERHTQSGSKNIEETFQYDGLNRLTRADVTGGAYTVTSFDAYGNLKTKNTYQNDGTHDVFASVGTYTYGGLNGGPHAVTATSIENLSYQYDANGNLTQNGMADGDTRTIQYTTFDKPKQIVKGNHRTEFKYGPDRARYKRIDTNTSTSDVTTTLYIGSVEKITNPNGTKDIKRYINGVAIITQHYSGSNTLTGTDTRYLYKDHLGSLDFMTDEFGTIEQEMSFDAWGKRRSATDWATWQFSISSAFDHTETMRGFTGHEMLDEVGLIHMNGRIYDPHIARFVQADVIVQYPNDTQSYNRYTYVRNNPLAFTDPSGYLFGIDDLLVTLVINSLLKAIENEIVRFVVATIINSAINFALEGANGSSISSFSNQVRFAASTNTSISFSPGEYRTFASGTSEPIANISNSTVGSTYSEVTGGKFVNGGETQSFLSAFNSTPSWDEVLVSDETIDIIDNTIEILDYVDIVSDVFVVGSVISGGTSAVVGVPGKVLAKIGKAGLKKLAKILRDKAAKRTVAKKELHRPYIRKNVRETVESKAKKTADGRFRDANTGKPIDGKYDLGHKRGNEFRREKAKAEAEGLSQKQFNDRMNNPDLYQIEHPSLNRSHKFEKP